MGLRPILSSLMRNSAGPLLVAIQIALTLAIVVNAVFVTEQRLTKIGRDSGMDDTNIFAVPVTSFEKNHDFFGMVRADLAMLRDMPGVVDAAPTTQIPLSGGGSSTQFYSLPDKKGEKSPVAYYNSDEHAVQTLGLKLAGHIRRECMRAERAAALQLLDPHATDERARHLQRARLRHRQPALRRPARHHQLQHRFDR